MANQETKGKCPGNCIGCSLYQRSYCATQMCRNIQDLLMHLTQEVAELKSMLLDNVGTQLIEPETTEITNISTQDGADNSPIV